MSRRNRVLELARRIGEVETEVLRLEGLKQELRKLHREFNALVPDEAADERDSAGAEVETSVADQIVSALGAAPSCELAVTDLVATLEGVAPTTVRTVAARLTEQGRLKRVRRGVYQLASGTEGKGDNRWPFEDEQTGTQSPATHNGVAESDLSDDDDIPF